MTTNQPEETEQPLTRRQLRELRATGAIPVVEETEAAREATPPVSVEEEWTPGGPVLTRRQARLSRTAGIPIVSDTTDEAASAETAVEDAPTAAAGADDGEESDITEIVEVDEEVVDATITGEQAPLVIEDVASVIETDDQELVAVAEDAENATDAADADVVDATVTGEHERVVAEGFGAELLDEKDVKIELPSSFDQLLTRDISEGGSSSSPHALILTETPDTGALTVPLTGTGEILITGSFELPAGFGATGTHPGTADGAEADASLIDGELPAASSPVPVAASSAISTVRSDDDIIRPPAPERGGKLMIALVITAGALALALAGVLIVSAVTGVFQ